MTSLDNHAAEEELEIPGCAVCRCDWVRASRMPVPCLVAMHEQSAAERRGVQDGIC
jgi:hypothetical protein